MKYGLVIFDFDGTLADSFSFFVDALNQLADKYRFTRLDGDELRAARHFDIKAVASYCGLPLWKIPMVANDTVRLLSRDIERMSLFNGVSELLQRLADAGVIMALVTSNSIDNVRCVLGPSNAARIAHFECGVPMFGKRAKFKKVVRKFKFPPSEIICIGDEIRDFEAAKEEGLAFGAVAWGYANVDALRALSPEMVFMNVADIGNQILN